MFELTTSTTSASTNDITAQLKALEGLRLGPHELSIIGSKIAEMVLSTVPEGYTLRSWIYENEAEIDSLIFKNFDNSNLVHALQFAELELRKHL